MSLLRLTWAGVLSILFVAYLICEILVLGFAKHYLQDSLQAQNVQIASELRFDHQHAPDIQSFINDLQAKTQTYDWQIIQHSQNPAHPMDISIASMAENTSCVYAAWFCNSVKLHVSPVVLQLGDIRIAAVAKASQAYTLLWKLLNTLTVLFVSTAMMLCAGLFFLNRWAFRPLHGIYQQLEGICQGRSEYRPVPVLREWHGLARMVNVMIERINAMFNEQSASLGSIREELEHDPLTRFFNRGVFIEQLKNGLAQPPDEQHPNTVVLIRVHNLLGINQKMGRERTDDFLMAISSLIRARAYALNGDNIVFGRLNSSEFGIFFPYVSQDAMLRWLEATANSLNALHEQGMTDSLHVAWIAALSCQQNEDIASILLSLDHLVMECEAQRKLYVMTSSEQLLNAITVPEWPSVIENAIETQKVGLDEWAIMTTDQTLLHQHTQLWMQLPRGDIITAQAFKIPAIRSGRMIDLDMASLDLLVQRLENSQAPHSITVSVHSIQKPVFLKRLSHVLQTAKFDTHCFWLEVEDNDLMNALYDFEHVAQIIKPYHCKLGISHFGEHFSALPKLKGLGLDYIKLDEQLCMAITADTARQAFIRLAAHLCHELHITAIATHVAHGQDAKTLTDLGIQAMGRVDSEPDESKIEIGYAAT